MYVCVYQNKIFTLKTYYLKYCHCKLGNFRHLLIIENVLNLQKSKCDGPFGPMISTYNFNPPEEGKDSNSSKTNILKDISFLLQREASLMSF